MKQLVVLGATGTVGRQTLDVAARHPERVQVLGLSAHRDVEGLAALCRAHRPRFVALSDPAAAARLKAMLADPAVTLLSGPDALATLAALPEASHVMSAIVGAVGLLPTLAAVRAGKHVLIANKEPLVMAGALLMREAAASGATLLPIDSEHNALFQCLPAGSRCGVTPVGVERLTLTASGGPFRSWSLEQMQRATPEQALRHPNWRMGPKISVDSATMMNKGLELIEAAQLFALPAQRIDILVHPQSTVHSLVHYVDGSVLAQLGSADMRVPIAHALAWPERWTSGAEALDLLALGRLDFEAPDETRFPSLRLAREALDDGGVRPLVLNAANEVAVEAFLAHRLPFTAMARLIADCLNLPWPASAPESLEAHLALDAEARARAREWLEQTRGAP